MQHYDGDSDGGHKLAVRDSKYKTSDEQVLVTSDRLTLDVVWLNMVRIDVRCEASTSRLRVSESSYREMCSLQITVFCLVIPEGSRLPRCTLSTPSVGEPQQSTESLAGLLATTHRPGFDFRRVV